MGTSSSERPRVVIIGAGPAGLSCAHQLLEHEQRCIVLEADPTYVGGLARTVCFEGNRFDIGGHRFFTRSPRVNEFWNSVLGSEMLSKPRQSRILYRNRFLQYPLQLADAFKQLGWKFLLSACTSYLWAQAFGPRTDRSFEDWIIRRFGKTLYRSFFKSYTEKVWGMPCSEISADWAAQRIQGLSIPAILKSVFQRSNTSQIKTLIDQFQYPRLGPGQLWETVTTQLVAAGTSVHLDQRVRSISQSGLGYQITTTTSDGVLHTWECDSIVSTMPLRELVLSLSPQAPESIIKAASSLRYRDFIAVALIVECPSPFADQWLYIHEPHLKVGRVQNMINWSEAMVANPSETVLLLEYFCNDDESLWNSTDEEIIALARRELEELALAPGARIRTGKVIRTPKAYPVYDATYANNLDKLKRFLADTHPQLQTIGRNGMHRYNNQDHAILTGFLAADALLGTECPTRPWQINQDAQYIEERLVPRSIVE